MQKPLSLSLAAALVLTGCTAFKTSQTWDKVSHVRPDRLADDGDPSNAYAAKLHRVLQDGAIDHKVVTYQYRYTTRLREEAIGTRTAVLYKDETNPGNPWWLMDDRSGRPVWVPNQDVNKQVAFYLRHEAEVVEAKDFAFSAPVENTMIAGGQRQVQTRQIARAKKSPAPSAPAPEYAQNRPAAAVVAAPISSPGEPTTIQVVMRTVMPWLRPARLTPDSAAALHEDETFRAVHGTKFDPASATDRRKMEQLKHASLQLAQPTAQTF